MVLDLALQAATRHKRPKSLRRFLADRFVTTVDQALLAVLGSVKAPQADALTVDPQGVAIDDLDAGECRGEKKRRRAIRARIVAVYRHVPSGSTA
jgi:hypothetical protein